MVDREAVLNNAKYLRHLRPVDPEEVTEYVEGQPHPAVVRQVLREEAFDLGLVERSDGLFVPVAAEPVDPGSGWSPDAFPRTHAGTLLDLLVDRFGPDWPTGDSGEKLRESIRRLKADYFHGNPVEYDETAALAYAVYHLPAAYATPGFVLDELAGEGLLDRRLRVLDIGAGVGGPALGLAEYLPADALVDYHAVEPSAAADILEAMLEDSSTNFHVSVHRERAEAFAPERLLGGRERPDEGGGADGFDVVLASNVLSELDDPVSVLRRYLDVLERDGTLVAIAPADLETSTGLRRVERALADEGPMTVFSPTLRLWEEESPSDRGWSFTRREDLEVPEFQRRLEEAGGGDGTYLNVDVQFSYALLRLDSRRRFDVRADPDRHARMAEMDRHVTERIDLLAVKLSHDLSEGGNPLFKIGDGSESVEHYAVLTRESVLNEDLRQAAYGAVLSFENALALWNDDEGAYNLVVDAETVVETLAR